MFHLLSYPCLLNYLFRNVVELMTVSCLQVADVKKSIETVHGSDVYPAAQQMLIYQGKVLKDGTTLIENNVAENSFVVIMLSKVIISLNVTVELFHYASLVDLIFCFHEL